jgi:hypothetical protein
MLNNSNIAGESQINQALSTKIDLSNMQRAGMKNSSHQTYSAMGPQQSRFS